MTIAAKIQKYLQAHQVCYQTFNHAKTVTLQQAVESLKVAPKSLARCVILGDVQGLVMVVLRLDYKLDFGALNRLMNRHLKILPRREADRLFYDCEPGSHPPLGEPYGLPMVVDTGLLRSNYIYFEPGSHTSLVRLSRDDFQFLTSKAQWASFSVPVENTSSISSHWERATESDEALLKLYAPGVNQIRQDMEAKFSIPHLKEEFKAILNSAKSTEASVQSLVELIKPYASTTEALIKLANCGLQDQSHPVHSLEEAIESVLGIAKASYLAFAHLVFKQFSLQDNGLIGATALWQHAVLAAELTQALTIKAECDQKLQPSIAYLTALLQNVGLLVIGHLFKTEYRLLNKMLLMNKEVPMEILEQRILGMGEARKVLATGHAFIGSWVLADWQMPEVVTTVAKEHHNSLYEGPHANYVHIIYLANSLLRQKGIGDGRKLPLAALPLSRFGLTPACVTTALQESLVYQEDNEHPHVGVAP